MKNNFEEDNESSIQQRIQATQNNSLRWVVVIIIILILGGGYFTYTKYMSDTNNINSSSISFNDNAAVVLTKDFNYPGEKPSEIYALPSQFSGAISYKIFINNTLVDSGQPKFGSAGSFPINTSVFKNGLNTLRLEADPHPEIGEFKKGSACGVAVIAVNRDDIVSTEIEENDNILASIKCPVMFVDE